MVSDKEMRDREKRALLAKEEAKENQTKRYSKILFNHVVYCIGDYLLLRETQNSTIVGRLVDIIPYGGSPSSQSGP